MSDPKENPRIDAIPGENSRLSVPNRSRIESEYELIKTVRLIEVERRFSKALGGYRDGYREEIDRVLDEVFAERSRELKAAGRVEMVGGELARVE